MPEDRDSHLGATALTMALWTSRKERVNSLIHERNMNAANQNNIAAPSVTIAPRNPARGVLTFVVTLTTHKDVRSYPCRSMDSAIKLAERFIAGVTKPARPATLEYCRSYTVWPNAPARALAPGNEPHPSPGLDHL